MNYTPTRNTKLPPIVKGSAIDRNKNTWAGLIGWWLYRLITLFKKAKPEPTPVFLNLCSLIPLKQIKHYWNQKGVECVDFEIKDAHLIIGYLPGVLFLKLHNNKEYVQKQLPFATANTKKGLQTVLGVINSMQISLRDKEAKR